jgi:hypothetical protein
MPQREPIDPPLDNFSEPKSADRRDRNSDKPRVSLCMIARDEEKRLATCLQSIAGLVDEIVVVDMRMLRFT